MPEGFPSDLDQYLHQEALAPSAQGASVKGSDPYVEAVHEVLNAKYAVLLAYITYGDQLRVVDRDGLYKHFQDHIEEERGWIYQLHRTLAARGEAHFPTGVSVPAPPLADPHPMLEALLGLEKQALGAWDALATAAEAQPERLALSGFAQEGARVELTHIEDLQRWLGGIR
jgi:hypothetical protein